MLSDLFTDPKRFSKASALFLLYIVSFLFFFRASFSILQGNEDKKTGLANINVDFNGYMTGALILKTNPKNLYDAEVQKQTQQQYLDKEMNGFLAFRNTPLVSFLYIPYTLVPTGSAYLINYFVQISLILLFIGLLVIFIGYKKPLVPLAFIFPTAVMQAAYGQVTILLALVLLFVFYLVKTDKLFWAGVLSAFLMLKINYLIFIPYLMLILRRKTNYLIGLVVSLFLLILVDSLIYRGFYLFDYISFISNSENSNMGLGPSTLFNITAFLRHFNLSGQTLYLIIACLYITSLVVVYLVKTKVSYEKLFASIVLFTFSINFHMTQPDLISLLIPIFILGNDKDIDSRFLIPILFLIPLSPLCNLQSVAPVVLLGASLYILYFSYRRVSPKVL